MNIQRLYWQIFNFLGRRVLALSFAVGGLLGGIVSIPRLLPGGTVDVDGVPSSDFGDRLIIVVVPFVVAVLGIALFRVKLYYPKGLNTGAQKEGN